MSIDVTRRWALPAEVSAAEPGSGPPTVLADLPPTTLPGWPAPPPAWDGPPPSWWRPVPASLLRPAPAMGRLAGADPGEYLGSLAGPVPRRLPWADIRHRTFVIVAFALALAALYAVQAALWPHAAPPHTGLGQAWSWASLLWVTALIPAAAGLAGLLTHRYPRNLHLTVPVDVPVWLIREETASGRLRIGQGTILYHRNWKAHPFLTLADSSRTDRLGEAVSHLPLSGEFDSTKCQCGGLACVLDAGPERSQADDDCAADADGGGRHGGVHAGSVRAGMQSQTAHARIVHCQAHRAPGGVLRVVAGLPVGVVPAAVRAARLAVVARRVERKSGGLGNTDPLASPYPMFC